MKKLLILLAVGAVVVPVLVFSESPIITTIPHLINYQGMLTDNLGSPLNGTPDITFEIWNAPSGGANRWSETQSNVSVVNGLFNVILGNVNPINLSFYQDTAYWLQIIVEEDTLPSRLKFTSVAFAYRAQKSDTAAYAISGGSYSHNHDADYVNVTGPDSIKGSSSSYMFRVKNYGTGDGIYLYTPGSVGDAIYIDSAGDNGIEITDVAGYGIWMDNIHDDGIYMGDVDDYGIYMDDVGDDGIYINDAGDAGLYVKLADNGVYIDSTRDNYDGMHIRYAEDDGVQVSNAGGDGLYVYHADRHGLYIDDSDDDGILVSSADGYGIEAHGLAGGGELYSDGNRFNFGLIVHAYKDSQAYEGLFVWGRSYSTGGYVKSVPGPTGDVPAFSVSSRDVELIASGTGILVNGQAQITFEPEFREAISPEIPIRVVVTAQGAPSALLYVDNKSTLGFAVKQLEIPGLSLKSDNAIFDWIAIARQKGHEQRPDVFMRPEEESRADKLRREEEKRAEELKHQEELQRDARYRQEMMEKQARRDAERKEREKEERSTD